MAEDVTPLLAPAGLCGFLGLFGAGFWTKRHAGFRGLAGVLGATGGLSGGSALPEGDGGRVLAFRHTAMKHTPKIGARQVS